jgi:hypothetical protein
LGCRAGRNRGRNQAKTYKNRQFRHISGDFVQFIVEIGLFELTFLPQKTHGIHRQVSPDPRQHWGFAHTLPVHLNLRATLKPAQPRQQAKQLKHP